MKEPNIEDLVDAPELEKKIKSALGTATKTRITINIDSQTLKQIKEEALKERLPYQHLLNKYLGTYLDQKNSQDEWRDKIEKEIAELKSKVAG